MTISSTAIIELIFPNSFSLLTSICPSICKNVFHIVQSFYFFLNNQKIPLIMISTTASLIINAKIEDNNPVNRPTISTRKIIGIINFSNFLIIVTLYIFDNKSAFFALNSSSVKIPASFNFPNFSNIENTSSCCGAACCTTTVLACLSSCLMLLRYS